MENRDQKLKALYYNRLYIETGMGLPYSNIKIVDSNQFSRFVTRYKSIISLNEWNKQMLEERVEKVMKQFLDERFMVDTIEESFQLPTISKFTSDNDQIEFYKDQTAQILRISHQLLTASDIVLKDVIVNNASGTVVRIDNKKDFFLTRFVSSVFDTRRQPDSIFETLDEIRKMPQDRISLPRKPIFNLETFHRKLSEIYDFNNPSTYNEGVGDEMLTYNRFKIINVQYILLVVEALVVLSIANDI